VLHVELRLRFAEFRYFEVDVLCFGEINDRFDDICVDWFPLADFPVTFKVI
jgi:hypothetical protein